MADTNEDQMTPSDWRNPDNEVQPPDTVPAPREPSRDYTMEGPGTSSTVPPSTVPPRTSSAQSSSTQVDATQPANTPRRIFKVSIDEGEFDSDAEQVPLFEAVRILNKRIQLDMASVIMMLEGGDQTKLLESKRNFAPSRANLAEKLAQLLPAELRTKDALENMDIRAVLQQVMLSPDEVSPNGTTEVSSTKGGEDGTSNYTTTFTDLERHIASLSITFQTEKLREQLQAPYVDRILPNADGSMNEEVASALDVIDDILDGYKDGTTRRIPTGDQTGAVRLDDNEQAIAVDPLDVVASDVANIFNAAGDDTDAVTSPSRFLSQGDIMRMLAGGEIDIETLREMEQAFPGSVQDPTSDPLNPGTVSHDARIAYNTVTYGKSTMPEGYTMSAAQEDKVKGGERPWQKQNNEWYSVNEVLSLPGSFSPEERVALVKRLEKGGFLQKGTVIGGDTTSQAFKSAWSSLAQSSLERNVSMTTFLDQRTEAYQETIMSSLATRLTDPARLRASGDYMAKQTLGRKLTNDEQSKMVEFLHNLERRNSMIEAGLDATEGAANGADQLDEGITADIDARMQEWITDENAVESQAKDTLSQYDQFVKMLNGPGRGM